ncbi:hypothetical protein PCANC_13798 [Puccinia coronata f. sp. avenae]|uniref:DUF7727 domain-containing protein n=1 Tax=Puccinia coronata f. sp. avenae TaxID=200324 RepID=A0A2N5SEV9_9BASI|nr:hypothetical protein PCANC_21172 [Puccinia coronata f. sp. avenae]PLW13387.1 hypothetical protein PCASD_19193 [Puccinia coronata f. sp. avenae]PLW36613.1 hypothetical protein PCASD_11368 [Puccinia coronata f. sp. avenae]PLW44112.1 hypothetical protein PCANC_13798 [Puccinia coronata f. sp. avenae]
MGKFIWSQWARLVALVAGAWQFWGALWAIFYRKYFWDFIGGKLGPTGTIAAGFAAPFVQLIITVPVIQATCVMCGLVTMLLEWPLNPEKVFYRSHIFKIVFYLPSAVLAALLYQTADAAVIYLIACLAYTVAIRNGETANTKAIESSKV